MKTISETPLRVVLLFLMSVFYLQANAQTYVSTGDCGHRITECEGAKLTSAARDFLVAP